MLEKRNIYIPMRNVFFNKIKTISTISKNCNVFRAHLSSIMIGTTQKRTFFVSRVLLYQVTELH